MPSSKNRTSDTARAVEALHADYDALGALEALGLYLPDEEARRVALARLRYSRFRIADEVAELMQLRQAGADTSATGERLTWGEGDGVVQ